MIDTAGTLVQRRQGAHARRRDDASCASRRTACSAAPPLQRIADSPLDEVVVSDSIPPSAAVKACAKIRYLSVGKLLGEAIRRIHRTDSVSSLFV